MWKKETNSCWENNNNRTTKPEDPKSWSAHLTPSHQIVDDNDARFWYKVGAPLNRLQPSSKIFFIDRSKALLLLWIIYVISVLCLLCLCLFVPCGHLLGKGWPLGSRLWFITVSLSLSHWYPVSGVVLDCIDSCSLHPYLLLHCQDQPRIIIWTNFVRLISLKIQMIGHLFQRWRGLLGKWMIFTWHGI